MLNIGDWDRYIIPPTPEELGEESPQVSTPEDTQPEPKADAKHEPPPKKGKR